MTALAAASSPPRPPSGPHAPVVLIAELMPGTHAYCDNPRTGPAIVVIDTGPIEIQLSFPDGRATLADLRTIDSIVETLAVQRAALLASMR